MKAPDKIYLYRETAHDYFDEGWGHNEASDVESVEYIRKDLLLEWAKDNLLECEVSNDEADYGRIDAFKKLIDKLNSL